MCHHQTHSPPRSVPPTLLDLLHPTPSTCSLPTFCSVPPPVHATASLCCSPSTQWKGLTSPLPCYPPALLQSALWHFWGTNAGGTHVLPVLWEPALRLYWLAFKVGFPVGSTNILCAHFLLYQQSLFFANKYFAKVGIAVSIPNSWIYFFLDFWNCHSLKLIEQQGFTKIVKVDKRP